MYWIKWPVVAYFSVFTILGAMGHRTHVHYSRVTCHRWGEGWLDLSESLRRLFLFQTLLATRRPNWTDTGTERWDDTNQHFFSLSGRLQLSVWFPMKSCYFESCGGGSAGPSLSIRVRSVVMFAENPPLPHPLLIVYLRRKTQRTQCEEKGRVRALGKLQLGSVCSLCSFFNSAPRT